MFFSRQFDQSRIQNGVNRKLMHAAFLRGILLIVAGIHVIQIVPNDVNVQISTIKCKYLFDYNQDRGVQLFSKKSNFRICCSHFCQIHTLELRGGFDQDSKSSKGSFREEGGRCFTIGTSDSLRHFRFHKLCSGPHCAQVSGTLRRVFAAHPTE
jgi:hypothetical protein